MVTQEAECTACLGVGTENLESGHVWMCDVCAGKGTIPTLVKRDPVLLRPVRCTFCKEIGCDCLSKLTRFFQIFMEADARTRTEKKVT